MEPVRMKTPASAAASPTVGANCRGGVTTDAMGWLKCGAGWTLLAPGRASTLESVHETHTTHTDTHRHTRFTQVRGPRVEVTPLLLPVSLYSGVSEVTMLLLELYHAHTHTSIS